MDSLMLGAYAGKCLEQVVKICGETDLYKKAALPVMVEARPCGVKATGQLWKGQDQNLVGHWTVAWAVEWPVVGSSPYVGC
jgi:hypothetical protein